MSSRSAQKAASSRSRRSEEKQKAAQAGEDGRRMPPIFFCFKLFYEGKQILDKNKIKFEKSMAFGPNTCYNRTNKLVRCEKRMNLLWN